MTARKPGDRVALLPTGQRLGTVEGVDEFYVRVVWDDGLGPYRNRPDALGEPGSIKHWAEEPDGERFVVAAPKPSSPHGGRRRKR